MIKFTIDWFKQDFYDVWSAWNILVGFTVPKWVVRIYYIICIPVCLALLIPVLIFRKIYVWNLFREIDKMM